MAGRHDGHGEGTVDPLLADHRRACDEFTQAADGVPDPLWTAAAWIAPK